MGYSAFILKGVSLFDLLDLLDFKGTVEFLAVLFTIYIYKSVSKVGGKTPRGVQGAIYSMIFTARRVVFSLNIFFFLCHSDVNAPIYNFISSVLYNKGASQQ